MDRVFYQSESPYLREEMPFFSKEQLPMLSNGLEPTEVFNAYWYFAWARQEMFFKRLTGNEVNLTNDPVLKNNRFTNAYRASDRVSQYLIKNVIYNHQTDSEDTFFRIILFKLFNKIETWECLESELGEISWHNYQYDKYNRILDRLMDSHVRIYSAAYVMPSASSYFKLKRKHSNHLKLIELMIRSNSVYKIQKAKSLNDVYQILLSFPSLGPFLAYQFTIDLNYSELIDFDENDFVVPGPGAKDGISKCFNDCNNTPYEYIIKAVTEQQDRYFDLMNLKFKTLWGRKLHLIDCQNIFCETDKYARVAFPHRTSSSNRTKIKQRFNLSKTKYDVWFPPKWGINDALLQWKKENDLSI